MLVRIVCVYVSMCVGAYSMYVSVCVGAYSMCVCFCILNVRNISELLTGFLYSHCKLRQPYQLMNRVMYVHEEVVMFSSL